MKKFILTALFSCSVVPFNAEAGRRLQTEALPSCIMTNKADFCSQFASRAADNFYNSISLAAQAREYASGYPRKTAEGNAALAACNSRVRQGTQQNPC